MEEDNRARIHSSRIRQLEQRLKTLEKTIECMPESPREKDGSKTMETEAQEIQDITEKLKLLGNSREKMPEERKKLFQKSLDFNNNAALKETASSENEVAAGRTPTLLEPNDSPISQDGQEDVRFIDRATSPVKLLKSEFKGKFPLWVLLGTVFDSIPQSSPDKVYLNAAWLEM